MRLILILLHELGKIRIAEQFNKDLSRISVQKPVPLKVIIK